MDLKELVLLIPIDCHIISLPGITLPIVGYRDQQSRKGRLCSLRRKSGRRTYSFGEQTTPHRRLQEVPAIPVIEGQEAPLQVEPPDGGMDAPLPLPDGDEKVHDHGATVI
jgi:hypothetical protein